MRYFMVVLFAVLMSGCATEATMIVKTQPSGAYITDVESGEAYGIAPVVVHYDLSGMTTDSAGCYSVVGLKAQWVSGAQAEKEAIQLCNGAGDYETLIIRDSSIPGLDQDLQFALQVQAVRAQQEQAASANYAAAAALMGAFSAAQQAYRPVPRPTYQPYQPAPVPQPQPTVRCTTSPVLGTLQTVCH